MPIYSARNVPGHYAVVLGILCYLALPSLGAAQIYTNSLAATDCPPPFFLRKNLAKNPSFEAVGHSGPTTCWQDGEATPQPAAAADWLMHSNDSDARVCSQLVPSTAPGPNGTHMLKFMASGTTGGVYQNTSPPREASYMFSAWVFVERGQVVIRSNDSGIGPAAWSTKTGEWEQLRVCTNSLSNTNQLGIYTQGSKGGTFFIDRVELRPILTEHIALQELDFPVGISETWFRQGSFCSQNIQFYPPTTGCVGWHTFNRTPVNAATLRRDILQKMPPFGTYQAPPFKIGDTVHFAGGQVASALLDVKALFDANKVWNATAGRWEWELFVPVYQDSEDCFATSLNPSGPKDIVGYATVFITNVLGPPSGQLIEGSVSCSQASFGP